MTESLRHCVKSLWQVVWLIVMVVAIGTVAITPSHSQESRPRPGSLAGQLLVATSDMPDPRFAQTVIYMIRHDATGAQGIVVNRPIREMSLSLLLGQMGMETRGVQQTIRLHAGGPVDTMRILVLHTAGFTSEGTLAVKDGYAVTWEPEIVRAIAQGKGPRRTLFIVGYAGWAPGQLEAEMKTGHWVKAAVDEAVLFDADDETKWDRAMARRKIDL